MTQPDHEERVDEFVDRYVDPNNRKWMEGGEVHNDEEAEWCLVQLRRSHREIERIQAAADAKRARIDAYQEQASIGPLNDIAHWEEVLIGYRRRLEREDPKLRLTYPLPSGVLKRVAGGTRLVVDDNDAFCDWAMENRPDLVKQVPLKDAIKQKADLQSVTAIEDMKDAARKSETNTVSDLTDITTGEIVPGVRIEVAPPNYYAKPDLSGS